MFEKLRGRGSTKQPGLRYWSVVTSDGKPHRKDEEGVDAGDRVPVSAKRLQELKDPKGRIQIDEINTYYFVSSAERDSFFKIVKNKVMAPSSVRKKEAEKRPLRAAQNLDETEFSIGPATSAAVASIARAFEKENEDAGKTLPLGENRRETDVEVLHKDIVYFIRIVSEEWKIIPVKPAKIPKGSRAFISEGEKSDLSRAASGDLRSAELFTIYFFSKVDAERVFKAYAKKAKERKLARKGSSDQ